MFLRFGEYMVGDVVIKFRNKFCQHLLLVTFIHHNMSRKQLQKMK